MICRKHRQNQKEKKLREIQATNRSIKSVSELQLDDEEERRLLQLIAGLDNIQLVSYAGSRNQDIRNEIVMTESEFKLKLLKTDRRIQKDLKEGSMIAPEKLADKIRKTVVAPNAKNDTVESGKVGDLMLTMAAKEAAEDSKSVSSSNQTIKNISTSVRVTLDIDKKGSKGKLVVISRTQTIQELVEMMRSKFNVGNKFNTIYVINGQTQTRLNETGLYTLSDGEMLRLYAEKTKAISVPNVSEKTQREVVEVVPTETMEESAEVVTSSVIINEIIEEASVVANVIESTQEQSKETNNNHRDHEDEINNNIIMEEPSNIDPSSSSSLAIEPESIEIEFRSKMASRQSNPILNQTLYDDYQRIHQHTNYLQTLHQHRNQLPIFKKKEELLQTIQAHPVTLVVGETGSGKTTQLPLYLLEEQILAHHGSETYIIVTQPRRIAAISVAERVHYEYYGQEDASKIAIGDGLVGYQVRLDSQISHHTRLVYMTTGVLLRKLQDPLFYQQVSHIILDEIHERGVSDFGSLLYLYCIIFKLKVFLL
jgi:ABC-type multidrug transport system fused ATPase/permease subunit